jgi:hypothetical protein
LVVLDAQGEGQRLRPGPRRVVVSDTVDGDCTRRGGFRPPSGTTCRDTTLSRTTTARRTRPLRGP